MADEFRVQRAKFKFGKQKARRNFSSGGSWKNNFLRLGQDGRALLLILLRRNLVSHVFRQQCLKLRLFVRRYRRCGRLNRLQSKLFSRIIHVGRRRRGRGRGRWSLNLCGWSRLGFHRMTGLFRRGHDRGDRNHRQCYRICSSFLLIQFLHFLIQSCPCGGLRIVVCGYDRGRRLCFSRRGCCGSCGDGCGRSGLFLRRAGRSYHDYRRCRRICGSLLRIQILHLLLQRRARGGLRGIVISACGNKTGANGGCAEQRQELGKLHDAFYVNFASDATAFLPVTNSFCQTPANG